MTSGKQYGLIMPKKKCNMTEVKRPSVFNNNSDSDDEDSKDVGLSDWIKKSFQKQAAQSSGVRRQTEIDMRKAIEQDPTVYKYDEIYDELEKKKLDEQKNKIDEKQKPRYIQSLLKKAQVRKLENERRIERQVQKERDAEGEEFKDKETFVTSSYRKKLEEFNRLDEEERRQDKLEEICDVSKQQDLGGFYRHLYKTIVNKDNSESRKILKESSINENDKKETKEENVNKHNINNMTQKVKREYRKRKTSESSSLEEGEHSTDSDTSISSSSSSSGSSITKNNKKTIGTVNIEVPSKPKQFKFDCDEKEIENVNEDKNSERNKHNKKDEASSNTAEKIKKDDSTSSELKSLVKEERQINIWKKRTVGLVLEAALKRYFERKAERQAMHGN